MRLLAKVLLLFFAGSSATAAPAPTLTFEDRLRAEGAILRVYHARQGDRRPFTEVASRPVLERRVRDYLDRSIALERIWHAPITAEMLDREVQRIVRDSQAPDLLTELFAALGNDPLLVRECLARRTLAVRLSESFFAADERAHGRSWQEWQSTIASELEPAEVVVEAAQGPLPTIPADVTCRDDVWDNGVLDDVPQGLIDHVAVWTGSVMIVFGNAPAHAYGMLYDPSIDLWSPMVRPHFDIPPEFTAVWTGTEMVIWGSDPNGVGARYDPVQNTWTPTSPVGAPAPRREHTAVWTGSEMIVWGGESPNLSGTYYANGGRYDPATDSWDTIRTNDPDLPSVRSHHAAVWTGSEMIVWGGRTTNLAHLADGARYDPVADRWDDMTAVGAPTGRENHQAVWTGSEMIVWGGELDTPPFPGSTATGGRYDPVNDQWSATSLTGAPAARSTHTAVWTGSEMIVWGGTPFGAAGELGTGGRYDPVADAWNPTTQDTAPSARYQHTAVWTGTRMIIWGGQAGLNNPSGATRTGGRYDPASDSWTPTSTGPASLIGLLQPGVVWTGAEMIVWGGSGVGGERYDPALDAWIAMSLDGAPSIRGPAVWTGSEMILWGPHAAASTGGRYDPLLDAWNPMSLTDAPQRRFGHAVVWNGREMVVWGGGRVDPCTNGYFQDGGRYDPDQDAWTPIPSTGAPPGRANPTAVWTGREVIVWGGERVIPEDCAFTAPVNSGGRYDPAHEQWISMPPSSGRRDHVAVWTGSEMIVWGGHDGLGYTNSGERYAPGGAWIPLPVTADTPPAAGGALGVWTGGELLIWGGGDPPYGDAVDGGGRFDVLTHAWSAMQHSGEPAPRYWHGGVWTGSSLIVWGGAPARALNGGYVFDDGGRYVATRDHDADGICSDVDNCTLASNPDQSDSDADGHGDACDLCPFCIPCYGDTAQHDDVDGDRIAEVCDNCPTVANPDQADRDGELVLMQATFATASSEVTSADWSAMQATGAPENPGVCADLPTNWSPLGSTADPEWLSLEYPVHLPTVGVNVHESLQQRFVGRIELQDTTDAVHVAWTGPDNTTCGDVLEARWPITPYRVRIARVHTAAPEWEEIDAVELLGVFEDPDGVGNACDICAGLPDASQQDSDGDGAGNACDCAPGNPSIRPAAEVNVLVESLGDGTARMTWEQAAGATSYAVIRGELSELSDTHLGECRVAGLSTLLWDDPELPATGTGFFYLIRGESAACGPGSLGFGAYGLPRLSSGTECS